MLLCRWKESIHVSGEGEGSKATLVAWLKRRAEADFGHGVVGRNVWVCWYDPTAHAAFTRCAMLFVKVCSTQH